ncbi:hypothetical protein HanIR_Chr16g0810931 [Helianthus annuus]|nr:hypothetical protein HanIR_Chr16g0810931 [Helianthus annuus]
MFVSITVEVPTRSGPCFFIGAIRGTRHEPHLAILSQISRYVFFFSPATRGAYLLLCKTFSSYNSEVRVLLKT